MSASTGLPRHRAATDSSRSVSAPACDNTRLPAEVPSRAAGDVVRRLIVLCGPRRWRRVLHVVASSFLTIGAPAALAAAQCPGTDFISARTTVVGTTPWALASGDLNEDSRPDILVANYGSDNISVLLGDGAGGFSSRVDYPVASAPTALVVGDFNRDGHADVAVTNQNANVVSVYYGDGTGALSGRRNFGVGGAPQAIVALHLDSDDNPDLVVANKTTNDVSILLGDGAGGFAAATNVTVGARPQALTTGDFNEDGRNDVAVASNESDATSSVSSTVSILLNNGSGGLTSGTPAWVSGMPWTIATADWDGDSHVDLIVSYQRNRDNGFIGVKRGDGTGLFSDWSDWYARVGSVERHTTDRRR